MAEVFISYKSERRAAAEHLAEILADYGFTVWWDYGLVSGRDFGAQIERELRAAKVVVILWCSLSRTSEWVLDEASVAKQLGTALPCMIERVDLPLGFGRTQTIDLSDWDGSPESHKLDRLVRDVAQMVGRAPVRNEEGLARTERAWRRFGAPDLRTFGLIDPLERSNPSRTLPSALGAPVATPVTPPPTPTPPTAETPTGAPSGAPAADQPGRRLALIGGGLALAAALLAVGVFIGQSGNDVPSSVPAAAPAAAEAAAPAVAATQTLVEAAVTSFQKNAAPPAAPAWTVMAWSPPYPVTGARSGLQAKAEPRDAAADVGRIRTNRELTVIGRTLFEDAHWLQVRLSGGEEGFVRESDTAPYVEEPAAAPAASAAPAAPAAAPASGLSYAIEGRWRESYDPSGYCDTLQQLTYAGGNRFSRTTGESRYDEYGDLSGVIWQYGSTYYLEDDSSEVWSVSGNRLTRSTSTWTCEFTRQ